MTGSTNSQWVTGHRIKGRYEIADIKQGGLATVYICYDHEFNDAIAVKTFQERFLSEPGVVRRFQSEAELWMRLEKHENVVWAKWVDKINGRPCVFMEYIKGHEKYGSDLAQWLAKGRLTIELVISFAIQICTGLIYAQRKFAQMSLPFVHRDIKPANIMVTQSGVAKVTDFGLAKVFGAVTRGRGELNSVSGKEETNVLTRVGDVFGTPPYMAPEQWVSSGNIDIRADIYSLGCVLYEMITSKPPFVCKQLAGFKDNHLYKKPERPARSNEAIPDKLAKLVMKCMEKAPGQRYQTFEELRDELNGISYGLNGIWHKYNDNGETLGIDDLSNMAMALHELGKSREALDYYDRLLTRIADEIVPEMVARVFNNRGNCYSSLGDSDKALANYLLAKRIDSAYDFPWHNSASIYMDRGDYERALMEVDQAIQINSKYADSHARRADILLRIKRYDEALEECNAAITLDSTHRWAYSTRGDCYQAIGEIAKAKSDYEQRDRMTVSQ